MAYTLATVRNRVLNDKLDDTEFDPEIVDNFINDTQRDIFNTYELPFTEKAFSGVVPIGGTVFTLPSDFQEEQALKLTSPDGNKRDLTKQYIGFRQFNTQFPVPADNSPGVPSFWTMYAGNLYFDRPTDQQYVMELFYVRSADTLEDDNDIPGVPEAFSEALILGAYYRCLQRNEDFDLATSIKEGEYREQISTMLTRLGKRQSGTANIMPTPRRRVTRRR